MYEIARTNRYFEAKNKDEDHGENEHIEIELVKDDDAHVRNANDGLPENEAFALAKLVKNYRTEKGDQKIKTINHLYGHIYL